MNLSSIQNTQSRLKTFKIIYRDHHDVERDITLKATNIRQLTTNIEYDYGINIDDILHVKEV